VQVESQRSGFFRSSIRARMSRQQKVDLVFYYFLSHFYFPFDLFFIVSIFRTLGLGLEVIDHISHI